MLTSISWYQERGGFKPSKSPGSIFSTSQCWWLKNQRQGCTASASSRFTSEKFHFNSQIYGSLTQTPFYQTCNGTPQKFLQLVMRGPDNNHHLQMKSPFPANVTELPQIHQTQQYFHRRKQLQPSAWKYTPACMRTGKRSSNPPLLCSFKKSRRHSGLSPSARSHRHWQGLNFLLGLIYDEVTTRIFSL